MSSAEFHALCGKYIREREKALGIGNKSLLGVAYECGVPIYTSSPGDSSIGMNVAALALEGNKCTIDPNADVNETASIVLAAKRSGGKSAVLICGGGSPKNFALQTEPQIQEVLGIDEKGHDYFLQITDARPDTGGLSGATPAEAVSWGKIDPDRLPDAVVCYLDTTVALPLLTAYAHARHEPRPLKRLLDRREENMRVLRSEFAQGERRTERAGRHGCEAADAPVAPAGVHRSPFTVHRSRPAHVHRRFAASRVRRRMRDRRGKSSSACPMTGSSGSRTRRRSRWATSRSSSP